MDRQVGLTLAIVGFVWLAWLPAVLIIRDIRARRWDREAARIHAAQDAAHDRLVADLTNLGERVRAQAEWDAHCASVVREPTPLHDELSAQMLRAELDDEEAVRTWLA
jgi:hypothetical protein